MPVIGRIEDDALLLDPALPRRTKRRSSTISRSCDARTLPRMIVGTAGHIDHGKTALVRALTGVDTDRLKEEKARGISIDLGFAYCRAPDGDVLGFVDVPGHERFVRNMLAGATGIDFVLLVVAADDGVMPQTREHLAIVDLLGIARGIVALTKVDLVSPERRAEVARGDPRHAARHGARRRARSSRLDRDRRGHRRAARRAARGRAHDSRRARCDGRLPARRRPLLHACRRRHGRDRARCCRAPSPWATPSSSAPPGLRRACARSTPRTDPRERGAAGERCALNLVGDGVTQGRDRARRRRARSGAARADASASTPRCACSRANANRSRIGRRVRLHHAAAEVAARVGAARRAADRARRARPRAARARTADCRRGRRPFRRARHDRLTARSAAAASSTCGRRSAGAARPRGSHSSMRSGTRTRAKRSPRRWIVGHSSST